MQTVMEKSRPWVLPLVLILFILLALTFPHILSMTYIDLGSQPDYILTYRPDVLEWDEDTPVDPATGSAIFDMFAPAYDGTVASHDGRDVAAPGTTNGHVVRLYNKSAAQLRYTAVLYLMGDSGEVPLKSGLRPVDLGDFVDTEGGYVLTNADPEKIRSYHGKLPEHLSDALVLQGLTGDLEEFTYQDFSVAWLWEYFETEQQDIIDTELGSRDTPVPVNLGLYITVETADGHYLPRICFDSSRDAYAVLLGICALLFGLLLLDQYRDRKRHAREEAELDDLLGGMNG